MGIKRGNDKENLCFEGADQSSMGILVPGPGSFQPTGQRCKTGTNMEVKLYKIPLLPVLRAQTLRDYSLLGLLA